VVIHDETLKEPPTARAMSDHTLQELKADAAPSSELNFPGEIRPAGSSDLGYGRALVNIEIKNPTAASIPSPNWRTKPKGSKKARMMDR
jgi:hypothetical protein